MQNLWILGGLCHEWGSHLSASPLTGCLGKGHLVDPKTWRNRCRLHLLTLQDGSHCSGTGNWKKAVLPGMQELGGGSLERHKYFGFLWALTHCCTKVHSLFFISLWYHCPGYIHKHRNRILFCSLTPFPSQLQEAHQETFIGCCYVSIHREQNMHFQPEMTLFQTKEKQQHERITVESPGEDAVCASPLK